MRLSVLLAIALITGICPSLLALPQEQLGSRAKSDLKKQLTKYTRAKKESDKERAAQGIFRRGRRGLEFLAGLTLKEKDQASLEALKAESTNALGLDILKAGASAKKSEWARSYISFDEIVLMKKGKVFAGFLIHETPEAASGELTYSWWRQEGPAKKLDQGGGTKGERIQVKGKKASKPFKPNAGYDEYEYTLTVGELKARVRFIGPAYFLYKLEKAEHFCFTGMNKPSKLSSSDKKITFVDGKNDAVDKIKKELATYVFRIVPGAEPLNMEEGDASGFAQYQSVQVEIRRTRMTSKLIVLIRFAEPEAITFEPYMPDYFANFIRELSFIEDKNLLISAGAAPSYEANKYWAKGKWIAAKGPITKYLRRNFPEDY